MSGETAAADAKKPAEKPTEKAEKTEKAPEPKKANGKKTVESPESTTTVAARDTGKTVAEETKAEPKEILKIETDDSGSFVEFHVEMTLNIGNMEFAKIHVGRRAPHKVGEAEADAAIKVIKGWVRREFRDEVKAVREKREAANKAKKEQRGRGRGRD